MNDMNTGDEQWYPQLPEGYTSQPTQDNRWGSQQMAWNGWNQHAQQGWHPQPQPPGWNHWESDSSQQGWPGFPQQPGWPWSGGMNPTPPPGPPSYPGSGGGSGSQQGAPTAAPPSQAPTYPDQQLMRVDPGGIRGCMYRYTYIWTSRRKGFWF